MATIAGGNKTLGGTDNDRKVVVYQGVGVFTKDNYKTSTISTTTATATTATSTTATSAVAVEKDIRREVTKAVVTKPPRMAVDGTGTGSGAAADITPGVDDVNEGGLEEGGELEVSSPSKGKIRSTGTLTVSIGTLTDAW